MMSHTAQMAARYGGGTGPPKMNVLEQILRTVLSSGVQVTKPPRQEKAFDNEPAMRTLSSVPSTSRSTINRSPAGATDGRRPMLASVTLGKIKVSATPSQ